MVAKETAANSASDISDFEELKKEIERVGNQIRQMKASHTDKVCSYYGDILTMLL